MQDESNQVIIRTKPVIKFSHVTTGVCVVTDRSETGVADLFLSRHEHTADCLGVGWSLATG